ncbi:MAG: 3-phosphoshikimate 1-carboxyvinyltransferase [Coriobacteriales bacterium]|jgi:3-phosphoshikimate 1-carboxyvinyltransferase|nr:3-phosphoshikimate 1-carboxyvinyltransferase [Coriobacteriales bacterium]
MPQPLRGAIRVPSDKSLSHRIALFSALAQGTSHVQGLLDSLDVRSTLGAIEALGAKVELHASEASEGGLFGTITGWGPAGPRAPKGALDCGNSGTTVRLLMGALAGFDISVVLEGDESLSARPMQRVAKPLSLMGACIAPTEPRCMACGKGADTLPLTLTGKHPLSAIHYESPVASAQVKSAVLLAGLNTQGTTSVTEPHKSRDHSELLLPAYGAKVTVDNTTVSIEGGQKLHACDCAAPGDPSSGAFLLVAAALIPGSEVTVRGMLLNPTRTGFLGVMRRMGADIAIKTSNIKQLGAEAVGDVTVRYREGLVATLIDAHEIPTLIDEVPVLALLATAARGMTVFKQVGELRVKESDRLAAIVAGLNALGCIAHEVGDELHVAVGLPQVAHCTLETHGDHRLAMTWAVAARAFDLDLDIRARESVSVSYPGFFDDLERLS